MPDKNENLKELFSTFLSDAEAAEAADDVTQDLELFAEFEAPEPGDEVLARINAEIAEKLASRPAAGVRWVRWSAVAAAAVVLIGLAVVLLRPGGGPTFRGPDEPWWRGEGVAALSAEIDDLRERMIAISRLEYSFEETLSDFDFVELEELEMVASNDDFWKD